MAIQGVDTKCYILALFIRDDDERFLLGSGQFEFKDSQKQFEANAIQNDVVEVQGNDGYLLAGQVRRSGTQNFDGYVGDGTMAKTEVEENRRKFFAFYQKNHFYRVVYVFPDGTAIQRKRGFLVDDPTVQELYQQYPEYHVALNFEDVNYYTYSENEQGEEIYAEEAIIDLSVLRATGGLIWDEYGAVSDGFAWGGETTVSGTDFKIQNELDLPAPVTDAKIYGDTEQQNYSGKNLVNIHGTLSERNVTTTISGENITVVSSNSADTARVEVPVSYVANQQVTISFDATCNVYQPSTPNLAIVYMRVGNTSTTRITLPTSSGVTTHYEVTFTPTVDGMSLWLYVKSSPVSGIASYQFRNIQIEAGSTATDYEPYVGGVPAPNPDYPQDIHVVTGEQTVTVTGKNLFNPDSPITSQISNVIVTKTALKNGVRLTATTVPSNANNYTGAVFIIGKVADYIGKTIRFSSTAIPSSSSSTRCYIGTCNSSGSSRSAKIIEGGVSGTYNYDLSWTVASDSNQYICIVLYEAIGSTITVGDYVDFTDAQVEVGPTTTAYMPYQTPQSYTVDLGTTELCKLGDYQDYIYKSGDDWYLHKEITKKIFDGSMDESWVVSYTGTQNYFYKYSSISDYLYTGSGRDGWVNNMALPANVGSTTTAWGSMITNIGELRVRWGTEMSNSGWRTKLATTNMILYYVLVTPTDTKITDTTLVTQLNALGKMKLFVGENNVLVSASDTNLPGELALTYYTTLDTTGSGYVWEEGGSGGPTMVEISSITNVYPIWKVFGPAVNPELSILTTNTTLTYNGTVASGQYLVIDMMNKTAKLNGTSVIGNVSGDWVNLRPGVNRVVYATDNSDTPASIIEWQEVVG